ncbi:MAG TPA: hypothetical protein VMH61_01130 [Candidatus Acidoferrales bacterium]|nr:hypothetical protein [Candidatus Acidoferrales bacterium]
MRHHPTARTAAPLVALIAALALAAAPARAASNTDLFWQAPDLAARGITAIALLPLATYDGNATARVTAQGALEQAFHAKGYRWVTWTTTNDAIVSAGGDSLAKAVSHALLQQGRLDSLQAPLVSRVAGARAVLCGRIDRYERVDVAPLDSGTPSVSVQLHLALVDSTGTLLWSASGSETAEGQYHEAVQTSHGLESSASAAPDPTLPSERDLLLRLLTRWAARFPARAAPAAAN